MRAPESGHGCRSAEVGDQKGAVLPAFWVTLNPKP